MARIQDHDSIYSFFKHLVDWVFRHSYRRIQYVGKENIPSDGAVIFAPNHTNALQDALAILTINPGHKVFVARADIFKKNKRLTWLLHGLKIMPINRMRDGVDELKHNDETLENAVNTLADGVPFCILPEGTHRPKHSLLPLGKGIFRIALRANEKHGQQRNIYIVPVGLEYGDYFHLWDSLTVNIGAPINVTQRVREFRSQQLTEPQMMLHLRDELTQRMREQILWVPDDENYETNIQQLLDNPPAPFNRFKKHKIPKWLLLTALIVLSPLFLISAVITAPLWIIWLIIQHTISDPAFHNSVQWLVQFVLIPLSLFITLPFWMFFQEYMYQLRKLTTVHSAPKTIVVK
ncbi:MAG: 1-acyl-sn-glycerol-3-phosphate acyltransferase [Paludibacteraceae bacterium]|nr:1-acyl-sn-glycerol-3-phosphate acyltransferase [Paludibacteraceae bacterium]